MKLTKLIREYVSDEVAKAYSGRKNPHSEQAAVDRAAIVDLQKKLKEQQKSMLTEFAEAHNVVHYRSGKPVAGDVCTSTPSLYDWRTEAMFLEEKWNQQNQVDRDKKEREILLSVELGATKNELVEMIQSLIKEAEE